MKGSLGPSCHPFPGSHPSCADLPWNAMGNRHARRASVPTASPRGATATGCSLRRFSRPLRTRLFAERHGRSRWPWKIAVTPETTVEHGGASVAAIDNRPPTWIVTRNGLEFSRVPVGAGDMPFASRSVRHRRQSDRRDRKPPESRKRESRFDEARLLRPGSGATAVTHDAGFGTSRVAEVATDRAETAGRYASSSLRTRPSPETLWGRPRRSCTSAYWSMPSR